jgi:hypothetical protein
MATKALTSKLIKELGAELTKTGFLAIAYSNVGIPRSTFYFWKNQAEELSKEYPTRENVPAEDQLLLEFLDTIQISRAKAGKKMTDAAFKAAQTDGHLALKILERIFRHESEFAPPVYREGTDDAPASDNGTGIALIPSMSGDNDLDQMLQQQQSEALLLAKTETSKLS